MRTIERLDDLRVAAAGTALEAYVLRARGTRSASGESAVTWIRELIAAYPLLREAVLAAAEPHYWRDSAARENRDRLAAALKALDKP